MPQKDAQSALRTVLEERRRELAFRGSLRLFDLKRLNREDAFRKEVKHYVGDEEFVLPANDPRYILPLPPRVIAANPGLPQLER